MARDRLPIEVDLTEPIPGGIRDPLLHEGAHLGPLRGTQEEAIGPDELERIPLDRVVTRGDAEAASGMMMLDGELERGGRREADVDHIGADALEGRAGHRVEEGAGDAAIAAQHDGARGAARDRPGPEGGGVACDDFRGQPMADPSPDAGDADHQTRIGGHP